ncbi:MAG: sn-glycerol-3-phosphate ABC transporter ATP-binding protein UgpC [Candidatus Omnitrophota bacterium]|nr:sn-glycerol-3-phosphate ABC transporter ATP-binding protein UgpC [Candidatus Omnitrophota bacterium]
MARVSLKDVCKVYPGNIEAVRSVSLEVEDKEFVVLVGPSGCGKSTTLRMIAGLEDITKGEIWIGNKMINDVPPKDRDIAMVFQNYALYPHMTVYENMSFALKLRKYPKSEIETRVREAAEILSITKLLNRRPGELSGGQRQRVAVGRAIVRKPLVFLFDEPLSNLDAKMRVQMRAELNKLHLRLQSTMIYVTHDQTEAMTMGNRIVVMKDGVIQQVADPIALYDKPVNKFVAGFIGSPPMNFVNGKIIKKESKFFFIAEGFIAKIIDEMYKKLASYENKEIIFGIRPEDIHDKLFTSMASSENTVKAVVEMVEPMGAEVFLYLAAGKSSLTARVGGHNKLEVHQDMDLVFDMSNAHFFNKDTEDMII